MSTNNTEQNINVSKGKLQQELSKALSEIRLNATIKPHTDGWQNVSAPITVVGVPDKIISRVLGEAAKDWPCHKLKPYGGQCDLHCADCSLRSEWFMRWFGAQP